MPLYAAGFGAFVLLGLVQAGYGPAFPLLEQRFGVSQAQVAGVSSAHFVGSALGPLLVGLLQSRLTLRQVLLLGALLFALGLLGLAVSSVWALVLLCALVAGLGYGFVSGGLNPVFAVLGAGPSSLVNALYGVGSVAAPLLALGVGAYPLPLVLTGIGALGVWLLLRNVHSWPQQSAEITQASLNWARLGLFGLFLFVYVGYETGLGSWAISFLQAQAYPRPELLTSAYWLSLTVGRFAAAALGRHISPPALLLFSVLGTGLGAVLIGVSALMPLGMVVAGLSLAPIFPAALSWFTLQFPARSAPYLLTLGSAGAAVIPYFIGLLIAGYGARALPLALLADAALLLALLGILSRGHLSARRSRRP